MNHAISQLIAIYERHPISASRILGRLRYAEMNGRTLRQEDLESSDKHYGLSDQNHVGGVDAVVALGLAAGVSSQSHVLDIGAGIGGSARALASRFGCRVHGIDVSPQRCRDAQLLTQLVGLDELVTFECGDGQSLEVPIGRYDVLWGQGAWCHFASLSVVIQRWLPALKSGGRVAFEDSRLMRSPTGDESEAELLGRLQSQWQSYMLPASMWETILRDVGVSVYLHQDITAMLKESLDLLVEKNPRETIDPEEYISWCDARHLVDVGLVGYGRIVGRV